MENWRCRRAKGTGAAQITIVQGHGSRKGKGNRIILSRGSSLGTQRTTNHSIGNSSIYGNSGRGPFVALYYIRPGLHHRVVERVGRRVTRFAPSSTEEIKSGAG